MMQDTTTFNRDIVGVGIVGGAQGVVLSTADPIWTNSEASAQMSPADARAIAALLIAAADECDAQRAAQGLPEYPAKPSKPIFGTR